MSMTEQIHSCSSSPPRSHYLTLTLGFKTSALIHTCKMLEDSPKIIANFCDGLGTEKWMGLESDRTALGSRLVTLGK